MRALVIYSGTGGLDVLAEGVARGLRSVSFQAELRVAGSSGSAPLSVAPYDVVCFGSPVLGMWGGQYAEDIDYTVKRCTRLEGKNVAVFVKPKWIGTTKAIRRLMGLLERQGAWVQDFASVSAPEEARTFGERLDTLAKKGP